MSPRKKILVVDDDDAVIEFLHAKLEKLYDIVSTNAAEHAAGLARSEHPDLILCDVDMPDMDGGDISSLFYGDDELRDIPIIFLTGLISPGELKRTRDQVGGRLAVSKQAPFNELLAKVQGVIGS